MLAINSVFELERVFDRRDDVELVLVQTQRAAPRDRHGLKSNIVLRVLRYLWRDVEWAGDDAPLLVDGEDVRRAFGTHKIRQALRQLALALRLESC